MKQRETANRIRERVKETELERIERVLKGKENRAEERNNNMGRI